MPTCTFLPRSEVVSLTPPAGYHLVSISDDMDDQAMVDEGRWASVSYHFFVDAGFDEDVIEIYGSDFELHYADYFLAHKADELRKRLDDLAKGRQDIVVNCQAGRSRSAAVAIYLNRHHGYALDKPTPDANLCVYRMLAKDPKLMAAYPPASEQEMEDTSSRTGGSMKPRTFPLETHYWIATCTPIYVALMWLFIGAGVVNILVEESRPMGGALLGLGLVMWAARRWWLNILESDLGDSREI